MPGIIPLYETGPVTFSVSEAITGGMIVEAAPDGITVRVARAGSTACVGLALHDALPAGTSQAPTIPGVSASVNAAPLPSYVAVANFGVFNLQYATAAVFGATLQAAAGGLVANLVTPPPDPTMIVGMCYQSGGVAINGFGAVLLDF
jgi:hypothetical protein